MARTSSSEPASEPASAVGRPQRRRRPLRVVLILLGVVLFLAVTSVVARFFSAENVERDHELLLVQAEAKGDVPGMLAQLSGCAANAQCVARVRANAAALHRRGAVEILSTQSTTDHSLGGSVGRTRVAWKVNGRYPVVQCITVRRSGNFLTGISVALEEIGPRLGSTSDC